MHSPLDLTEHEVTQLTEQQLPQVIGLLLKLEALANGIFTSSVYVPLAITIADGGEDACIVWDGNPKRTNRLPNNNTMFQLKATVISDRKLRNELMDKKSKLLKDRIDKCLEEKGAYIIVTTKKMTRTIREGKVEIMRSILRELSKPYSNNCEIHIYDAAILKDWINEYYQATVFVRSLLGLATFLALQIWQKWDTYEGVKGKFIGNGTLDKHIETLRANLQKDKSVCRITGLSGLGKTKLAHEVFRPGDDLISKMFSDSILYFDSRGQSAKDSEGLLTFVTTVCHNGKKGVLVIDNCDITLHNALRQEVVCDESKLSLLTIDYNREKTSYYDIQVHLQPDFFIDIIPKIIHELDWGITPADERRITEFAQGFPLLAVLLAQQKVRGSAYLGSLDDSEIVSKLIGVQANDSDTLKVLKACAIFDKVGFSDELDTQRKFIASSRDISGLYYSEDDADKRFFEICTDYIEKGILERRGRYILLKPKPLAIRLAAEWWAKIRPEKVEAILAEITKHQMSEALCNQLTFLDFLPEARQLTAKLCGPMGPFGNAEVLNTEEGSRLFRSFAEVNPAAICESLGSIFGNQPIEILLQIHAGRRNLIWTLEKLVYHADLFYDAGKVLFLFAVAENETWSNNATNQFLQLFHIHLPGTAANLEERKRLLVHCLQFSGEKYRKITLGGFYNALVSDHFSRSGGAETQGSKSPIDDYSPKTYRELFDYWRFAVDSLLVILKDEQQYGPGVIEVFATSLRGLIDQNAFDIIVPALEAAIQYMPSRWPVVIESIDSAIHHCYILTEEQVQQLQRFKKAITPNSFDARYKTIVANPSIDDESVNRNNFAEYDNAIRINVKRFVQDAIDNKVDFLLHLPTIYENGQQEGVYFGELLAKLLKDIEGFVEASIIFLENNTGGSNNIAVLGGILSAIGSSNRGLVERIVGSFASHEHLRQFIVWLVNMVKPGRHEMSLLLSLLQNNTIHPREFETFAYGSATAHFTHDDIVWLVQQLLEQKQEVKWLAISILFAQIHRAPDKELKLAETIKLVVSKLELNNAIATMDAFKYKDCISRVLINSKDTDFALLVTGKILALCISHPYSFSIDNQLFPVIKLLFENYFDIVWPVMANIFTNDPQPGKPHLRSMLEARYGAYGHNGALVFADKEMLLESCRDNSELQRQVARMLPIEEDTKAVPAKWHVLTREFLNLFGNNEKALSMLSASLGTHTIVGSAVPLYKRKLSLMEQLEDHQIREVRQWAAENIKYLKESIRRETLHDDEWELA